MTVGALEAFFDYQPEDWVDQAACRGKATASGSYDAFFTQSQQQQTKRDLCAVCPVAWDCLDYAYRHDLDGLYGGMAAHERVWFRRRRKGDVTSNAARLDHRRQMTALHAGRRS